MLQEVTNEKARHVLGLSRTLHWDIPSSQGTPIIKGQTNGQRIEQALKQRH